MAGAILNFSALAHIGEADPRSAGWWWEWATCRGAIIFIWGLTCPLCVCS